MSKKKKNLVIVESPAKARTLEKFLGKDFEVKACGGHVRDLPPQRLGVDLKDKFEPTYITVKGKSDTIKNLKAAAQKANIVYLAPDPDREGEAIAWHLQNALGKGLTIKRIEFNEITKSAVQAAVAHPRDIDQDRVDAQQARRVLDRLVGYKISPILWKKIRKGLSAGRVQSVALRLICDRDAIIKAFKPEEYWKITAKVNKSEQENTFEARFIGQGEEKIKVTKDKQANKIVDAVKAAPFNITNVVRKEQKRHPAPPFITSSLQQEASRKLGYNARRTMSIAQRLYEGMEVKGEERVGLITYMRTDSFRVADQALDEVRRFIGDKYGKKYLPPKPIVYKKKKQAQDAHEAIRPTSVFRDPEKLKDSLTPEQYKLYLLIWNRFIACQMESARIDQTAVDIDAAGYTFRANGSIITFDGFIAVYTEGKDEEEEEQPEGVLPELAEGETLNLQEIIPTQHFTQPPARYSEASLVKELEQKGIGRPSTYAPIMGTITSRGYVEKEGKFLQPTKLGDTINFAMVKHFPNIVNVSFTAHMEDDLDDIVEGKVKWRKMIADFYTPFEKTLKKADKEMKKIKKEKMLDEKCPKCGKNLMIRDGRYGEFIACSGFPKCRFTRAIEEKKPEGEAAKGQPAEEKPKEICDKCGKPMVMKRSRYGAFWACSGYPDCKNIKSIVKEIGIDCPDCGGKLIVRRSRRGKIFYGCSNYPKCKFGLWSRPTGEKCPQCGSLLVDKISKGVVVGHKCSSKTCDYVKKLDEKPAEGESNV
ncbi:MAG: type I DNA topoisomerase [Candidatus Margulisbacteria bacterium]|nr:type I DNA topoisomerase [Candidatus Margulisiibacteriota bacterium]MBU1021722.1 type I DNA topoisomerase [Candidatus Margulisiibacteriota bacterium]MBU1729468.1 type I DNA topoisomerase [Candidatus Margulisiibacteriota bacterium]MBU1955431.1 type I DNA topoisomerase [Candidatus Margulisiibacteriota bacterium]